MTLSALCHGSHASQSHAQGPGLRSLGAECLVHREMCQTVPEVGEHRPRTRRAATPAHGPTGQAGAIVASRRVSRLSAGRPLLISGRISPACRPHRRTGGAYHHSRLGHQCSTAAPSHAPAAKILYREAARDAPRS